MNKQYINGVLGQWLKVTKINEVSVGQPVRWIFQRVSRGYAEPQHYRKGLYPIFDGTCEVEAWFPLKKKKKVAKPVVKVSIGREVGNTFTFCIPSLGVISASSWFYKGSAERAAFRFCKRIGAECVIVKEK